MHPQADPFAPSAGAPEAPSKTSARDRVEAFAGPEDGGRAGALLDFIRRPWMALLLLAAAVFTAYLPALDARFVWDDLMLIRDNASIRSPILALEAFRHTLFGGMSNFYRPSQTLLFIAEYWGWAKQPFGYHVVSILIHALNAFVLFLLLRRLLPSLAGDAGAPGENRRGARAMDLRALLLALVWALYPVHSAAVAYVSGSADSLAMLFCVVAWLAAERSLSAATRGGRAVWGTVASTCLLAGFCSKEIAFVWLTLFLAHLFCFSRPAGADPRRKFVLVAVSLSVVAGYLLLRHIPVMPPMPSNTQTFSHVELALRALGDYGSLLVFPARLLMERQVYPAPGAALTAEDQWFYTSLTVGGVLVLIVFALGAAWRGSGQRLRLFGVCWFFCGFLPVSNLFVTINAGVAEHWLYLPSIGFLIFAAGCAWQVPTPRMRAGAVVLAILAATGFGIRTYWRAFDWMDDMTFFQQTIAAGGDVPRAWLSVANAYSRRQGDATAVGILRKVVARHSADVLAEINLSNALVRTGRVEEAKPILENALSHSGNAEPHALLIIIRNLEGFEKDRPDWPKMKQEVLAKEREKYPDSWDLVQYDAHEDAASGHADRALGTVSAYAAGHWWHYPSWYLLGSMCAGQKQSAKAVAAFVQASRLDVHDADALCAAAGEWMKQGRFSEAVSLQREAVERQPDSPRLRSQYATILGAAGKAEEAGRQSAIAAGMLHQTVPAGR